MTAPPPYASIYYRDLDYLELFRIDFCYYLLIVILPTASRHPLVPPLAPPSCAPSCAIPMLPSTSMIPPTATASSEERNASASRNFSRPHPHASSFSVASIRAEFPALSSLNAGKPLVYLDSAASALKPRRVIDSISHFYANDYANVHRSAHSLGEKATAHYEGARDVVMRTIGARQREEIIFTKNATESINLVASSWGSLVSLRRDTTRSASEPVISESVLSEPVVIAISGMEHHSNLLPWQFLSERYGYRLIEIPLTQEGELDLNAYRDLLQNNRVSMVAVAHVSNVLGTINPIADLVELAHKHGSLILVDGSQGLPHLAVDVSVLDVDFYAFTGHKVYGPSGIGVLYGKRALLEELPPYQGGGEMVERVSFGSSSLNSLPWKFEAGTPPIAQAVGLSAALDFMASIGWESILSHESDLCAFVLDKLLGVDSLRLLGLTRTDKRAPIFSFVLEGTNAFDVASLLDKQGFCCRAGFHCAEPLIRGLGYNSGCVRASFGIYNQQEEGERLVEALTKARSMLV